MKQSRWYVFALTLVATMGGLLFGYDTAVISGTVESLRVFFIEPQNLPTAQAHSLEGFVVSSALIGCIIGACAAGWLSQKFGRKPSLIIAAVLFLLSALRSAWPEIFFGMPGDGDYTFLRHFVFYRISGGIGVGIASMVSPMYIAEVAPSDKRGTLVSWNQFAIVLGMLIIYFVNYGIAQQGDATWLHHYGWRWMFASEMIPAGLFLVALCFVPETPRYMMMRGRDEKALAVLRKISGDSAEKEMTAIRESLAEKEAPMQPFYVFLLTWIFFLVASFIVLRLCHVASAFEISLVASFLVALVVPIRNYGVPIIVVGVLLASLQQFIGINVVLYYAPEIFKTMGSATDTALLQQAVVGAVNLVFTILAILTVDRFGRRPLMIIGALVMALSMFVLGTTFHTHNVGVGSLVCMLVYTAGFAMSWGPVCWVLLSEIFPNSIRSMVMAVAVASQWISNFLVSWTFPMLDKNETLTSLFNHGFAYWLYGLMGILAALFIWKMVPETTGKSLEEMETYWKERRQSLR